MSYRNRNRDRDRDRNRSSNAGEQFEGRAMRGAPEGAGSYTIPLDTPGAQKLATVLYQQDGGNLFKYFAQKFGVFLDGQPSQGGVGFTGSAEAAERAKQGFKELSTMVDNTYVDKGLIAQVANKLSPPAGAGSAFKRAANQNGGGLNFVPRNDGQKELSDMIDNNSLTFAVGPAGTGKTYVAVIKAVQALKEGKIKKIVLTRPAQEAGEKLGYQPGNLADKLRLYMLPIYDELDKIFPNGGWKNMMENGTIELVGVGFMRGRTFSDAYILIDEAQNMTQGQLKMALTRIGENSKAVVTGDPGQMDIANSGLMDAVQRLRGRPGVAVQEFKSGEVVRSAIAQTVVNAYADIPDDQIVITAKTAPTIIEAPAEPSAPVTPPAAPVVTNDPPPFVKPAGNGAKPSNPQW